MSDKKEYIEREAAVQALNSEGITKNMRAHRKILAVPTADVEPVRHGEWVKETEYYADDYSECNVCQVYACSLCGRTEKRKELYCHCGAKMDGGKVDG